MNNKEYKKAFNKIYNFFTKAYLFFYVWKGLQDEDYNGIFQGDHYFWQAVLSSLENSWLIELSKIYEKGRYSEKNICVSNLVNSHPTKNCKEKAKKIMSSHNDLINNIKIWRDKHGVHYDLDFNINSKNFGKKCSIKYGKVEDLLEITGELLSLLHPVSEDEKKHSYVYKPFKNKAQRSAKTIIKKIKFYNQNKN